MKQTGISLFLVFFMLTGFILTASGQGNVIKLNIFSPIVKTFNIQYEKKLKSDASFQLGVFFSGAAIGDTDVSGFGITPEYRLYLSDLEAPQGVYVAPFVRYQNFTLTRGSDKGTLSTFGGGLILGKQWLFKQKVVLDMFLGPTYSSGSAELTSGSSSNFNTGSLSGYGVRAGICLGFAF